MEFTFKEKDSHNQHDLTRNFTIEEFMYPYMKTEFEVFGMHIRQVNGNWTYPLHAHPIYEMNFLIEGEQHFTLGDQLLEQRKGDLILIRPGESHGSKAVNQLGFTYACIHFNIDDKLFLPYLNETDKTLFATDSEVMAKLMPYLERIIQMIKQGERGLTYKLRMQAALIEMLSVLVVALTETKQQHLSGRTIELAYKIAKKMEDKMASSFENRQLNEQSWTIEAIAKELNISPSYCNKLFKQVYHMSPRKYLSLKKINHAKALLLESSLTIEYVGEQVGYYDSAHFSRQFKRWTGLSPTQYRKNQR